jgi:hypothetical protein
VKHTYIALVVLLVLFCGLYAYLIRVPAVDDRSGFDVLNWPPNTTEMCRLLGTNGTDPNTPVGLQARGRYLKLFKKRYRDHNPMMAIGMRFSSAGRLDLLTPARMEPWCMDRLAVNTWHEAQAAFGHPFDIDLFITYIGSPPLKIGELRRTKDSPDKLEIVHFARPRMPSRDGKVALRN